MEGATLALIGSNKSAVAPMTMMSNAEPRRMRDTSVPLAFFTNIERCRFRGMFEKARFQRARWEGKKAERSQPVTAKPLSFSKNTWSFTGDQEKSNNAFPPSFLPAFFTISGWNFFGIIPDLFVRKPSPLS